MVEMSEADLAELQGRADTTYDVLRSFTCRLYSLTSREESSPVEIALPRTGRDLAGLWIRREHHACFEVAGALAPPACSDFADPWRERRTFVHMPLALPVLAVAELHEEPLVFRIGVRPPSLTA